jgi:hypothetical protein
MNRLAAPFAVLLVVIGCSSAPVPSATMSPSAAPTASPAPTSTPGLTSAPSSTTTAGPTSTANPATLTPTAAPRLVIDAALIGQHLDALQVIADQNGGIRAAGTTGYDASADYVTGQMTALGFQVERQPFDFAFFDETQPVTMSVGGHSWSSPQWLHAALYSASGDVEGSLEWVGQGSPSGGCDRSDWSAFTTGHVAMVEAGGCYTRQKVEHAQSAGAAAMITFYPGWGADQTKRPTLVDPAGITIPVVAAGHDPWQTLSGMAGETASISVHGETHTATVDNVLATWPGQTDHVVMLGGHLDSVLDGPGINDNGSGVATLMAIAAAIATQPQPVSTISLGFWSAEEFGDLGSAAYVDQLASADRQRISAYFNLDMVGSPNPGRYVYDDVAAPSGSSDLTQRLLDALQALGEPGLPLDIGASSDHFAFERAGVPIGGLFSGLDPMDPNDALTFGGTALAPMDPCYHLACDTRANVDLDNATLLGQALADVLAGLVY